MRLNRLLAPCNGGLPLCNGADVAVVPTLQYCRRCSSADVALGTCSDHATNAACVGATVRRKLACGRIVAVGWRQLLSVGGERASLMRGRHAVVAAVVIANTRTRPHIWRCRLQFVPCPYPCPCPCRHAWSVLVPVSRKAAHSNGCDAARGGRLSDSHVCWR
jgi:hypothetical protein